MTQRPGFSILRTALAFALVGAAMLLAGCTGSSTPTAQPAGPPASSHAGSPATDAALPAGISARVYQTRFDLADRVLEVSVTNHSHQDFDLVSASFSSPHFAGAARTDGLLLAPGLTRDLRLKLPEPICGGDFTEPDSVTLVWRGGAPADADSGADSGAGASDDLSTATFEPLDSMQQVKRIANDDCLAEAVDTVLTITLPQQLRIEGAGAASVAWLDLTLAPTGAPGSVTVERVGQTVLITSPSGADWPVGRTIDASSPAAVLSLDFSPGRCDPHAVLEDKRGTILPLRVATSAGPAGVYDLPLGENLRAQVFDWIAASCGG